MTQVTPPGWYPDPGQTSDGPATERWWDGRAWTDQTRPVGSAAVWGPPAQQAAQHPYPGYPGHPGYPGRPPAPARRGLRIGIAVGVAAAVLASIGVGVYALAHDGGGKDGRAGSRQGRDGRGGGEERDPFGGPGGPGGSGDSGGSGGSGGSDGGPSGAPKIKSGSVTDAASGISLPIPDGWYGQELGVGAQVTSDNSYKCPGDTSKSCTKGGAYSAPALVLGVRGNTPEEVAKADIAANAEDSYGGEAYGGITSHEVLASKAVTVAGQKGYLVRWKAVTSKGADGNVESLAFASPGASRQLIVVRFGVDVGEPQSVIDDITRGIEAASGGGSGQSV
ncbi:DUF2510 domain-containing protein [Streptomyces sp. NPDC014889]|uniref:DUF2510 domain-containing protein n=1 Tax=Streptomyces sp. NPDC014889 TaxID=3364928 RepID=UPI003700C7A9